MNQLWVLFSRPSTWPNRIRLLVICWQGATIAFALAGFLFIVVGLSLSKSSRTYVFPIGMSTLALTGMVLCIARFRLFGVCKTAKQRNAECCPSCIFDLRGLAMAGPCPECGNHYHLHNARRDWQLAIHAFAR